VTDLVVAGTCGGSFLNALRDQAVPWQTTLDLSRMTFCEPIGLVGIAAVAERALARGARVVAKRPIDSNVARYLARMRLGAVLAALGAEHDLPYVDEHEVGDALLELTAFDGARGAGALAAHVHDIVERRHGLGPASALYDGLCEAGQNVEHHSERSRGFVAAQKYGDDRLMFAVGDSGVGLLATLRQRGATDDRGALERALTPGVSRMTDSARGNGLPDMIDHLHVMRGRLAVVSGQVSVIARGRQRWYHDARRPFAGTLLQGTVSTAP
jgi:hypothetical protein